MDMKSLIAKMDLIESKKFLTESAKPTKDCSTTDRKLRKFDKDSQKPIAQQDDENGSIIDTVKKVTESTSIAKSLLREFNLTEIDADGDRFEDDPNEDPAMTAAFNKFQRGVNAKSGNWDKITPAATPPFAPQTTPSPQPTAAPATTTPPQQSTATSTAPSPQSTATPTATSANNPWKDSNPVKAAAWEKLSPEDQKFLGSADPTDKYILARAPNKGATTMSPAQGDQMAADIARANAAPQTATPQTAAQAIQADVRKIDNAIAATTPGSKLAAQAVKTAAKPDPKVQALQQQLIKAGAKIKADGVMGPQTQAAMKQFPQAASSTKPAVLGSSTSSAAQPTAASTDAKIKEITASINELQQLRNNAPDAAKKGFDPALSQLTKQLTDLTNSAKSKPVDSANQTASTAARTGVTLNTTAGAGRGAQGGRASGEQPSPKVTSTSSYDQWAAQQPGYKQPVSIPAPDLTIPNAQPSTVTARRTQN